MRGKDETSLKTKCVNNEILDLSDSLKSQGNGVFLVERYKAGIAQNILNRNKHSRDLEEVQKVLFCCLKQAFHQIEL